MQDQDKPKDGERRDFIKQASAVAVGTAAGVVPVVAGLATLLDPLGRTGGALEKSFITNLSRLPEDGTPVKFPIIARRVDAWNQYEAAVGSIYLRRTENGGVQALNTTCPHAGCAIDFRGETRKFFCPCHNSSFKLDGSLLEVKSPSPRGMDGLEVEIRGDGEVWVLFQNFQTGTAAKHAIS
jgi:menaquinol-cytochrome c reductase iron-sulfur subunit